jgi:GMP synthase-like glutamine amidotransferase
MTDRVAFLGHSDGDVAGILGERARELGLSVSSWRADHGRPGLPAPGTFDLLVVMGSVRSVTDASVGWIGSERSLVGRAVADGVPVLGVCFGGQLLAQVLGGQVDRAPSPEIGWRLVETADPGRIPPGPWVSWHEDRFSAPPGAEPVARTEDCLQAFVLGVHTGVQFHPEADRRIVRHWVEEARRDGSLEAAAAAELLAGFGPDGRGPEAQARQLFDRFVERAGRQVP